MYLVPELTGKTAASTSALDRVFPCSGYRQSSIVISCRFICFGYIGILVRQGAQHAHSMSSSGFIGFDAR